MKSCLFASFGSGFPKRASHPTGVGHTVKQKREETGSVAAQAQRMVSQVGRSLVSMRLEVVGGCSRERELRW